MEGSALAADTEGSGEWAARNLPLVLAVMMRVVRNPELAFDLGTEALAEAALQWDRHRGEQSRMAWVLERVPALLERAIADSRVPCVERLRNRPRLSGRALTREEVAWLSGLVDQQLELDSEARHVAERVAREAPTALQWRRVALSPLVSLEETHDRA